MYRLTGLLAVVCLCGCVKPTQQTTPPAISFADLADFQQQQAATQSTSQFCVQPGLLAIGNYALPAKVGGCVTFSGGTGDAKVYVDEDGQLITEAAVGVTHSAATDQMTFRNAATPAFPDTAVPICDLNVANGAYSVDQCGLASRIRLGVLKAGIGLRKTTADGGKAMIEVDPAQVCLKGGDCGTSATPAAALTLPLWFPAAAVNADGGRDIGSGWSVLATANTGAALGSYAAAAGTHARAWLFFGPGVSTTAQLNYLLPANWIAPLAVRISWQSGDLAVAGSLFDLRVSTQCWTPDTRYTASKAWGPEQSSTDGIAGLNVHADEDWQIAKVDNLRMDNCAAGDMLAIQFRRDPAGSLDKEARIYGVELAVGVKQ